MNSQNKVEYSTLDQISKAPACPVTEQVANLIDEYSTVDHISKAPACPVTEPVMNPIGEEEEGMDVCSLHLFTILQSAVVVIIKVC